LWSEGGALGFFSGRGSGSRAVGLRPGRGARGWGARRGRVFLFAIPLLLKRFL